MLSKASATAVALIVLGCASLACASPSLARDAGGPPTVDIRKTCKENVDALGTSSLGGDVGQDLNVCLEDERMAREQIIKDWASYPAIARQRCIQTKEYLPGYVEWQACLDMTKDVLALRKQETGGTPASTTTATPSEPNTAAPAGSTTATPGSSGASPTRSAATRRRSGRRSNPVQSASSSECPIVKYTDDGSIRYIVNCPGPAMPGL